MTDSSEEYEAVKNNLYIDSNLLNPTQNLMNNLMIQKNDQINNMSYNNFQLSNSNVESFTIGAKTIFSANSLNLNLNINQNEEIDFDKTITEEDDSNVNKEKQSEGSALKETPISLFDPEAENKEVCEDGFQLGRWQPHEHNKFLQAMYLYGNEWKKVQEFIGTRSSTQARSHAQKFFIRLKKKFKLETSTKVTSEYDLNLNKAELILDWIRSQIPPQIICLSNDNSRVLDLINSLTSGGGIDIKYSRKRKSSTRAVDLFDQKENKDFLNAKRKQSKEFNQSSHAEISSEVYEQNPNKMIEQSLESAPLERKFTDKSIDSQIFNISKDQRKLSIRRKSSTLPPKLSENENILTNSNQQFCQQPSHHSYINIVNINIDNQKLNKKNEKEAEVFTEEPVVKFEENSSKQINLMQQQQLIYQLLMHNQPRANVNLVNNTNNMNPFLCSNDNLNNINNNIFSNNPFNCPANFFNNSFFDSERYNNTFDRNFEDDKNLYFISQQDNYIRNPNNNTIQQPNRSNEGKRDDFNLDEFFNNF